MESGSENVVLEYQRYGRNKNTLVNKTYIDSGEYRKKFDKLTDNPDVNKSLYDCAKTALKHRSGTEFEDMYWIDSKTGKVILSETKSTDKRAIIYTDEIRSVIKRNPNIITIHTHPSSMPPSIDDFNSCFNNGYDKGIIACHNGQIYIYSSKQSVNQVLYELYIKEYRENNCSESEAQLRALEKIIENHNIYFEEV